MGERGCLVGGELNVECQVSETKEIFPSHVFALVAAAWEAGFLT